MPRGAGQQKIIKGDLTWMKYGACNGVDPNVFFPELKAGRGNKQINEPSVQKALSFCKVCEVRPECLNYALTNHIKDGIWGGMSEGARDRLKRKAYRKRAAS